jgi:hypothetical protein
MRVIWGDIKLLWRNKYIAYNIIPISVILGVDWTYFLLCKQFLPT